MSDEYEFREPTWTFRPIVQKGEKVHNPNNSREFEKIGHVNSIPGDPPANSMDAQDDKSKPVVIEYGIWDDEHALPPEVSSRYFGEELKVHIRNVRDLPTKAERLSTFGKSMPYIALEDFNCVGLEGAIDMFNTPWEGISENELKEVNNNRFLWFNRAQNATSDDQDRRGSWGEGKFTLEWASKLQAQITWSRRLSSEPKNVLMGQTTLRRHTITNPAKGYGETLPSGKTDGQRFASYGFFSTTKYVNPKTGDYEYAPLPITGESQEGSDYIQEFRETFRLRRTDQPGTSVLIPHPRDDTGEDITNPDAIARATIARWLLTIHRGDMIFNIRRNGKLIYEISKDTIKDLVSNLEWSAEPEKIGTGKGLNPCYRTPGQWQALLGLLDWNENPTEEHTFVLDATMRGSKPSWQNPFHDSVDPEEQLTKLREAFDSGRPLKVVARPTVESKKGEPKYSEGSFDILLVKNNENNGTQLFAREAMTIPFMDSSVDGITAIVHCHQSNLLKLLRHAEGPAHLEWAPGAERVIPSGGFWNRGNSTIKYVNQSVRNLSIILKPKPEDGETTAVPLFEINIHVTDADAGGETKPGGVTSDYITSDPPPTIDLCRVPSKGKEGAVRIVNTRDVDLSGQNINVNLAYLTSRGNPFRKYREDDFAPSQLDLSVKAVKHIGTQVKPTHKDGLVYTFSVIDPKWSVEISGFDGIRDVYTLVTLQQEVMQ